VATSISVTSGTNRLTYAAYDASGNVTSYQPPSSTVTYNYTYDGLNMVQKSADSASHQSIYVYTADDERIWTYDLSAGVSHWKIRDLDNKELRDYTDTGASTWTAKDYFYRGSLLLAAATPAFGSTVASQEHFSVDHLGTPRLITNANHEKLGFHTYYPFGQEWLSAGNDTESRKFTGHERDSDPAGAGNDVDYMHARYYLPNVGRFLSVDPAIESVDAGRPQSWNRYTYVRGNPVNATDPTGRKLKFAGPDEALDLLKTSLNADLGKAATFSIGSDGIAGLAVNAGVNATKEQAALITMLSGAIADPKTVEIGVVNNERQFMGTTPENGPQTLDIGDMQAARGSCATTPGALAAHEIAEKWASQSFGQPIESAHLYGVKIENRVAPWQRFADRPPIVGPNYVNGHEQFEVRTPYMNGATRETVVFTIIDGKVVSVRP
jgi:RHS repeat-associated protein